MQIQTLHQCPVYAVTLRHLTKGHPNSKAGSRICCNKGNLSESDRARQSAEHSVAVVWTPALPVGRGPCLFDPTHVQNGTMVIKTKLWVGEKSVLQTKIATKSYAWLSHEACRPLLFTGSTWEKLMTSSLHNLMENTFLIGLLAASDVGNARYREVCPAGTPALARAWPWLN